MGAQVLRPDGTVFVVGASGHTSIYDTKSKAWTKGPIFPSSPSGDPCTVSDGPAALLPNGNVLVICSSGFYSYGSFQNGPSLWYEFDGTNLHIQKSPPGDIGYYSYCYYMLVLPTGQILQRPTCQHNKLDFYNPTNMSVQDSWRPLITSFPEAICPGAKNLRIAGIRLSGMSHGAAYGDDCQTDTNYPLVRITNTKTKHVFYCRTHDHSSVAVQSPLSSHTYFDVPSNIELGASVLEVVASGIPSLPSSITVVSNC